MAKIMRPDLFSKSWLALPVPGARHVPSQAGNETKAGSEDFETIFVSFTLINSPISSLAAPAIGVHSG